MIKSILGWVFKPLDDIKNPPIVEEHYDGTYEFVKEKPTMPEFKQNRKMLFRPDTFDVYIGQTKRKETLQNYIKCMKERDEVMPHVLIYGNAGCGKTTLAKIIAKELKVKFTEVITSSLDDSAMLISYINEVDGGVVFLDEVHAIERGVAESIYSIMEDFTYNGVPVKPFTLIGATTEIGELKATRKPFVDRFKIPIELEDYTIEDLAKITRQYRNVMFPLDTMDVKVYDIIAENCRHTPRIAIRLLEATIYGGNDIKKALSNFDIIKQGYTLKDLKTLRYIGQNPSGVGLQGMTSYLGTSAANYMSEIEPYLLQNGLLIRAPRGRKLTDLGKDKILELEKELK